MSASSFIVNLQWYLLSLPPPSPTLPPPPSRPFPISTPDITPTYEYPPIPLNPPARHPLRRIPARPKIPPSSVGSATNYCIGNRLDYQSFDNASSSAASALLRARSQHTLRILSPRYHSTVFRAMANYLLRRSMNSNRNYISPDIQLELPVRSACLWGMEKGERKSAIERAWRSSYIGMRRHLNLSSWESYIVRH